MPIRKRVRRALGGFSGGAQDVLSMLLQSRLAGQQQSRTQQGQIAGQTLDDAREILKRINPDYVAKVGPDRADAEVDQAYRMAGPNASLLGPRPNTARLDAPEPERVAGLTQELAGITNPDDLRLTSQGVRKRLPAYRIAETQPIQVHGFTDPMDRVLHAGQPEPSDALTQIEQLVNTQREGLLAKEPVTPRQRIRADGTQETVYGRPRDIASGLVEQTERTGAQESTRSGLVSEGQRAGTLRAENDPGAVAGSAARERGLASGRTQGQIDAETAPANVSAEARRSGALAGAQESGRLQVYHDPKFVGARVREAGEIALQQADATLGRQYRGDVQASVRAAGDLLPEYEKLVAVSQRVNNQTNGVAARAQGVAQRVGSFVGLEGADTREMQATMSRMYRRVAIAMGVREANASDKDGERAMQGMGVLFGNTAEENDRALQNLYDLITIAPVVAGKLGPGASMGDRLSLAQSLKQERTRVQDAATAAGAVQYLDPVTNAVTPVVGGR